MYLTVLILKENILVKNIRQQSQESNLINLNSTLERTSNSYASVTDGQCVKVFEWTCSETILTVDFSGWLL